MSVIAIIITIIKYILFSIIDWITIHLGKNPRKGGSPPILIITVTNDIFSIMDLDPIVIWLI